MARVCGALGQFTLQMSTILTALTHAKLIRVVGDIQREGAERGGVWGGGVPSLLGEESGEGAVPPPQKFF